MKIKIPITCIFILYLGLNLHAQKDAAISKEWNKENKGIAYKKQSKYKGPEDWYTYEPGTLEANPESFLESEEGSQFDRIIDRSRGNKKAKESKKEMKKPKEIKIPEFDPPEINDPDIDVDIDTPDPTKINKSTWRTILFILIFVAVITLLYFWLKRQNFNTKLNVEIDQNWNPEIITKPELEQRLETALNAETYREAVRVYFTMILQELIRLKQIKWRLDKTNHQYISELKDVSYRSQFQKATRYFDIVWYGEYEIDKPKFQEIQPHFVQFIQNLKAISNE